MRYIAAVLVTASLTDFLRLASALNVSIQIDTAIATASPLLVSHGWEAWQMMDELSTMQLPQPIAIIGHLSPSVVRVGGISADWIRYIVEPGMTDDHVSRFPREPLGGSWPSEPRNMSLYVLYSLIDMMASANTSLLFDLSELYGRNCNTTKPGCPSCDDWCATSPPWDMTNIRALLERIHEDNRTNTTLYGFELGNELASHLDPYANVADVLALASVIREIWSDNDVPPLLAPSTDDCWSSDMAQIMRNITPAVYAFTYHAYPAGNGSNLEAELLNTTWLRDSIMQGSKSANCIAAWNDGPRAAGVKLWLTEASSSWNWPGAKDPPWPRGVPGQNSFLHGFFTLPQLAQYAAAGVDVVARWALALNGGFATIDYAQGRFDVASDYWLLVAHKRLVAPGVLAVTVESLAGEAPPALVYASCALVPPSVTQRRTPSGNAWDLADAPHPLAGWRGRNVNAAAVATVAPGDGSIVIIAVNPSLTQVSIALTNVQTTPRVEWTFTAPGGNVSATAPLLNDNAVPLRIAEDGSLPPLPGAAVPADGSPLITLPPRSQAFVVLTNAGAAACRTGTAVA